MRPLLAHLYEPKRVSYPCFIQPKLNGIRALYQTGADGIGRFQSRDEIPFPPGLLDHLTVPLQSLFDQSIILDGELYRHGWSLQRINAAVTPVRQQPTEDTGLVEFHVFDRVDYGLSFHDRFEQWQHYHIHDIIPVSTRIAEDQAKADYYYSVFISQCYEGMMYRLGDCPYTLPKQPQVKTQSSRLKFLSDQDNRVWHMLKRKDWQDDEFECMSVVEGEGKYQGSLGALVCSSHASKLHDDKWGSRVRTWTNFSVGSGLTDAQRAKYWDHPELVIGHQIKVKYLCLSQDGIPLNPTILCIL